MKIEKTYEPSHIRRGRLSTDPTWWVVFDDGSRWSFQRKRDAVAFVAAGGVCVEHHDFLCDNCHGRRQVVRLTGQQLDG